MEKGIALATGAVGVRAGAHVHASGDGWEIRSAVPVTEEALLGAPVLDAILPGALGRYVYPEDAVLVSALPWKELCARERVTEVVEEARVNHLSVATPVDAVPAVEEDEDEDEDEDEEEDEGKGVVEEDVQWSDDEGAE